MDAFELLKGWPGWANANAKRVLDSPAWRMTVEYDGENTEVTCTTDVIPDPLWLEVSFDDERHLLGVADSEEFPELHRVWSRRALLPAEILLALAERECGALFQMLENATGRSFALKGVADESAADRAKVRTFQVGARDAETPRGRFALELSPALNLSFGQLKYLDTDHPSVREMTIAADIEYARFELAADELKSLAPGDFLLCEAEPAAKWRYGSEPVSGVRAVDAHPGQLTFGQLADDALPPAPAPEQLRIDIDGEAFAEGVFDRVVGQPAIRIVKVKGRED